MSQYIGARYVPKFEGTYDNTQAYENMVVVDNGMGTSYISKVPVPAGTPLTDTNYWALYGASNGAIINLQNQIGDLTSLTTSDQSDLVHAINEVDAEIDNYIDNNDVINRPTLFVGDSYGDESGEFIDTTISMLNMTNAVNLAVSGEGFTSGRNGNGFLEQITGYAGDKTAIKAIYVCGGLNDSTGSAALSANIDAFSAYVGANYPNAKLYLAYVGTARDNSVNIGGRYLAYRELAKSVYASKPAFNYVDLSGYLAVSNNNISADDIHPSASGTTALAIALAKWIRNGFINKVIQPQTAVTFTPSAPCNAILPMYYKIDGDIFTLMTQTNPYFRFNQSATIGSTPVKVGTFTNLFFNRKLEFNGLMRFDKFNNKTFQDVLCHVEFADDGVYIAALQINSAGTGYESYVADASDSVVYFVGTPELIADADGII